MQYIPLSFYVAIALILFILGFYTVLSRKNAIAILMGIELILNASNINFVAFWKYKQLPIEGVVFPVFIIFLAACEVAIALAIIINIYRNFITVDVDDVNTMKG